MIALDFFDGKFRICFLKHDQCLVPGDPDETWECRRRYVNFFGLVRPIWIYKPYSKTLEFGFEFAGVWYTVFFE